ncbi:uncharacterized protein [Amphiura filiformis]|uniref:uncharacterized protein isoform X2 n=1 Tax=Amphiura filiformis TaxID=82378 RepID=UPI003B21B88C
MRQPCTSKVWLTGRRVPRKKSSRRPRPKPPMFRSRPRPSRGSRPGPVYRSAPSRPAAFPRPTTRRPPPPQRQPNKPLAPSIRPLTSTYQNAPRKVEPPPPNKTSHKPSFGNQGFSNTRPSSEWGESIKPKNSSKVIVPPPLASANRTASSESRTPPPGSKSALVSVVSDARQQKQHQQQQQQVSSNLSKNQQPQRVLAPRFLKQMQRELEEQRQKDQEKENQRRQQAHHLATEDNNNDHDENVFETSPVREEWPARRQIVKEAGDWRSPSKQERTITPVSNISKPDDVRSQSPAGYEYAARATPPPSPAPEDAPYCNWFKKEIDTKASGLWRSSLNADFKKEFGVSLTDDIVEKMANLKIVTVEKVFNQEIVYPNLKVETKSSTSSRTVVVNGSTTGSLKVEATSSTSRQVVLNGSISSNQRHHSDSGSASPDQTITNSTALHRSSSVSSDTSSSTNRTTPTLTQSRQSPLPSPTPSSPLPSSSSPTMMVKPRRDDSAPDYSHLAVPLPEEEVWEVYVSYIKHLQDFYVLIVDEEYTAKLSNLEDEMGHYYKYSRRHLLGQPAENCIYAAELKNWCRVMVVKVHDTHVDCFLVDHGDTERVEIGKLQPLAPQFLHTPFQAIPCKLEGTEDDPENAEAVQKFCEVALGQVLYAESVSKEDAQVEIIMYDEDAVATINDLCLLV